MISPAYESFISGICIDIANESINIESIKKTINSIIEKLISLIKAFKDKITKFINNLFKTNKPESNKNESKETSKESKPKSYTLVNYKSLAYLECCNDMLDDIKSRITSISIMNDYMNASAQASLIKKMMQSVQSNSFSNGIWSKEVNDKFNFCYTHTDNMYIDNSELKDILNKRAKSFTNKANLYCLGLKKDINQRIDKVMKDEAQRHKRVELMAYTSKMVEDTSSLIQLIIAKVTVEIKSIAKMNVTNITDYDEYKPL